MNFIAWIAIAVAVGAIIACLAHVRGRSFTLWWIYGSLLGVVALPHLLLARDLSSDRRWAPVRYGLPTHDKACPFCGLPVHEEALVCRHCRQAVDPEVRRHGRMRQTGPVSATDSAAEKRPPAGESAATTVAGVTAGWTMASYTGFSTLSAKADAGAARMHIHRRRSAVSTGSSSLFEESGAAVADAPRRTVPHHVGDAPETVPGGERPTPARERPDGVDTAASRPISGSESGFGGTASASRRVRDTGALPRSAIFAALAACVVAALFVTPAWHYVADVVTLISPTAPDGVTEASDVHADTMMNSPRPGEPAAPSDRTADRDPAFDATPAPPSQALSPGAKSPVITDATTSSETLAGAFGPPDTEPTTSAPPKSTMQPAEPSPPSPSPVPAPKPNVVTDPPPRVAPTQTALFGSAAPKARPEYGGFDAEAQANFDSVVSQLQRRVAGRSETGGSRSTDRDTSVSAIGEVVYELQQKLKAKGFDPGGIDGRFGPQTRRALKAYQRDAGLPATGKIDKKVLIAFGLIS